MEFLIAIVGVLLKGLFSFLGASAESSAKSEAKAANKRADQILESVETERDIEKAVREVPDVHIDPNDIFGATLYPDPTPPM
jgi:hypothetical protein